MLFGVWFVWQEDAACILILQWNDTNQENGALALFCGSDLHVYSIQRENILAIFLMEWLGEEISACEISPFLNLQRNIRFYNLKKKIMEKKKKKALKMSRYKMKKNQHDSV